MTNLVRNQLRIINTAADLSPRFGGTSVVIPALSRAVRNNNSDIESFILVSRLGELQAADCLYRDSEMLIQSPKGPSFYQELCSMVTKETASRTLIHDHGMWLRCNHAAATFARRKSLVHMVTPHGMLAPWALKYKPWKKRLAWYLYARKDLSTVKVLHATSQSEANDLRRLGLKQPIAIIPNGVEETIACQFPRTEGTRPYALFLSRVHRVKGISELLEAWKLLPPSDWDLTIAGPDEQGLLRGASLPPNVRYVGETNGADKTDLIRKASLFILPSHTENFGLVVAESLMAGVPVITTHGTPWSGLVEHDCGWWISLTISNLRETMAHAMSLSHEHRYEMGVRGRDWMKQEFTWPSIGNKMANVYRWAIGSIKEAPPFVQVS